MIKPLTITILSLIPFSPLVADEPPNVIVIMADDLGYQDLGFQGSPDIKTPHLDEIAQSGIIFTDGHTAASVCSPSRAGFITARYQQRFGHEANCPPNGNGLDINEYTMGQAFQSLGYKSYMVGKWHLGNAKERHPTARGFDTFYGLREGSRSYFFKEGEKFAPRAIERDGKHIKFKGFLTDRMTDAAIEMIQSDKQNPFFLFLSYTAPHTPLQATEDDLAKANGNAYYALIQNMDDNIGRLIQSLKDEKRYENTIIWFLSDNGGAVGQASNYPFNGKKGIKLEGGQRVPFVFSWPAKITKAKKYDQLTSAMDIFPTSYALAGGKEKMPKPLDGVNLWPHIYGDEESAPHDILFWKKLEAKSVRKGEWKLILSEGLEPMLFNLATDLKERQNLASTMPDKVKELSNSIEQWEKGHVAPLWKEGKKFTDVRKRNYPEFIEAGDFRKLNELKSSKKKQKN